MALILMFIPLPEFIPLRDIPFGVLISKIIVFWGIIEAARDFIYPFFTGKLETKCSEVPKQTNEKHSKSSVILTIMIVLLFGLSIFSQEIYGYQEPLLSLIAESGLDYAFVAGAFLGLYVYIKNKMEI